MYEKEGDKTNCSVGPECGNRRFYNKRNIPVTICQEPLKGYGLKVDVNVAEDEFIVEYLGELIDSTVRSFFKTEDG